MELSCAGAGTPGLKGEIRIEEPDRAGRAIARRSAETRATVPDLELGSDAVVGDALALARDRDCSLTALLVRACGLALREHPRANASYRDGRFVLYSRANVGVAIHTDGGYVTPTVLDADTKPLEALNEELEVLARRARAGALTPPELAGATFTLSDLSELGAGHWSALVTPPQAAAVAAGAVRNAPIVREGAIVAGQLMSLTLSCDHRILFGAQAAAFLTSVVTLLERAQL